MERVAAGRVNVGRLDRKLFYPCEVTSAVYLEMDVLDSPLNLVIFNYFCRHNNFL